MQVLCHCLDKGQISSPEDVERICYLVYKNIFPVIVAVAVLTNIVNVVVLSYLHHTSSPNPARVYLLWLAITHCLTCVPVLIALLKNGRSNLSFAWAFYFSHLETPLYNAFNFVCVYVIVGLSLDRYSAVCNAHKYTQALGFRKAYLTATIAYAAAFVVYAPYCFHQKPQLRLNTSNEWYIGEGWLLHKPLWIAWALIVQTTHRIIPGVILIILNMQIFCTVTRLKKLRRGSSGKGSKIRHQKDRHLLHLLLALTVIFLLTNIPSAILKMTYFTKPGHCNLIWAEEVARAVSNCLEMSGYCFHFFLYFLMNAEYKRGLIGLSQVLCRFIPCCKKVPITSDITVTRSLTKK